MEVLLGICVVLLLAVLWMLLRLSQRVSGDVETAIVQALQMELRQARKDSSDAARGLREELSGAQKSGAELVVTTVGEMGKTQPPRSAAPTNRPPHKGLFHNESGMYKCDPCGIRL